MEGYQGHDSIYGHFQSFAFYFTPDFLIVPLSTLSLTAISQFDYLSQIAYSDYENNTLAPAA